MENENLKLGRVGLCPKCNGTGRVPSSEYNRKYQFEGYDKETDTTKCDNCGERGMFARKTDGKVHLRPDGNPCVHKFNHTLIGRCWHKYSCEHCGNSYTIDSGD